MHYELLCLFRYSNEPDGTLPPTVEAVTSLIQKHDATILSQDDWGVRRLSYPILHQATGHYLLFKIRCEPSAVPSLNRDLTLEQTLLRHQIVEPVKAQPTRSEEPPASRAASAAPMVSVPSDSPAPSAPRAPLSAEELDRTIEKILDEKFEEKI